MSSVLSLSLFAVFKLLYNLYMTALRGVTCQDTLLGRANICISKLSANERYMIECESIMVDKDILYMEISIEQRTES